MSETSFQLLLVLVIVGLIVIAIIVTAPLGALTGSAMPSTQDPSNTSSEHDYNANLGENENEYQEVIEQSSQDDSSDSDSEE